VVEHLPSKRKALSSSPSTTTTNKKLPEEILYEEATHNALYHLQLSKKAGQMSTQHQDNGTGGLGKEELDLNRQSLEAKMHLLH
jgi:hypothetical protein